MTAMTAQATRPESSAPCALQVIERSRQPPLRFRGRCLARHAAGAGAHRLELSLWACDSGGLVVALAIAGAGGAARMAERVPDAAAAARFAEAVRLPRSQSRPAAGGRRDAFRTAADLAARARAAALEAVWRDLIGEALADWEALEL